MVDVIVLTVVEVYLKKVFACCGGGDCVDCGGSLFELQVEGFLAGIVVEVVAKWSGGGDCGGGDYGDCDGPVEGGGLCGEVEPERGQPVAEEGGVGWEAEGRVLQTRPPGLIRVAEGPGGEGCGGEPRCPIHREGWPSELNATIPMTTTLT